MILGLRTAFEGLIERASVPVDAASLAVFRIAFGLLAVFGCGRFLAYDWVTRFYVNPEFHFKYWGFSWIEPLSGPAMHAVFGILIVLGVLIALGLFYRLAIVAFFLLFTYVELLDATMYLNHYYLVSLLAFLMIWMPLSSTWSLDAKLRPERASDTQPALFLWAIRFQMACVYFYAGLAKLGTEWLLDAQPLHIWMRARVETPLIGGMLGDWTVALVMAWAGFLFDLTIVAWLLWPKTRKLAFAVVVVFHFFTNLFFPIGLFSFIMVSCATVFLDPSWPRRFALGRGEAKRVARPVSTRGVKLGLASLIVFATIQIALPLRHLAYPGDVLWTEEGMRWSWKVMVREKNGAVTYRVKLPSRERELEVTPGRYLTQDQEREFGGQPDMILQLGQHIGAEYSALHGEEVEVRVNAVASMNGRLPAMLIRPEVDLMKVSDGLKRADWILDEQDGAARLARRYSL